MKATTLQGNLIMQIKSCTLMLIIQSLQSICSQRDTGGHQVQGMWTTAAQTLLKITVHHTDLQSNVELILM